MTPTCDTDKTVLNANNRAINAIKTVNRSTAQNFSHLFNFPAFLKSVFLRRRVRSELLSTLWHVTCTRRRLCTAVLCSTALFINLPIVYRCQSPCTETPQPPRTLIGSSVIAISSDPGWATPQQVPKPNKLVYHAIRPRTTLLRHRVGQKYTWSNYTTGTISTDILAKLWFQYAAREINY